MEKLLHSRMLKKSASFVLAALGDATYRTEYAFASSLAADALDGLFDHPASCSDAVPDLLRVLCCPCAKRVFQQPDRAASMGQWSRGKVEEARWCCDEDGALGTWDMEGWWGLNGWFGFGWRLMI